MSAVLRRVCGNRQFFYWYLTVEGIEYLREYLHLPEEIVPATLKKSASRPARPGPAPGGESHVHGFLLCGCLCFLPSGRSPTARGLKER